MWELLQVSNLCNNNNWLSELHNGQISLSFIPAQSKLDCVGRMLWIILTWKREYKLWFFQDSEREHVDVLMSFVVKP